jgi:prefoldin alpha subunit
MSERQLNQIMSQLEVGKAQLENLTRQQELIRGSLEEHMRAKETAEAFTKAAEGEEVLVPAGAGVFLHAKIGNAKSGIANIGAGVMMEKELPEIAKILDTRISELRGAAQELDEQAEKISYAIEQLSAQAEQQYVSMQKPGQPAKKK